MPNRNLTGKRFIGLLRCSSLSQADTSIDDQRRVLEAFAREQAMTGVDYIELEGVSGSLPGNRSDIQQLIDRKQANDDFDVLLVQDTSRLTRGGIQHAHKIESELNAAGIEVVFAKGAIPEGSVGDLIKSAYAFSDQQHAQAISYASARGAMSSIAGGRSPYCRRPPYGLDRLYIAPDGTPLHIIRNLPNGTQQMLDPKSSAVRRTFEPNSTSGVPNHYIKQKDERVALIPGDPKAVEVVRRIYRLHFIDNMGALNITLALNTDGIPAPNGGDWNKQTVGEILKNPIYLGRGIANRYTTAIYNMRSPDRPVEKIVEKQELYKRKQPAKRVRPRSQWFEVDYPEFTDFLDPEVRELAAAKQQAHLDRQGSGTKSKPNRDRHRKSPYFLKGILRSKQGGHPMTGVKSGNKKRYYRVTKVLYSRTPDKVLRKMVPAEPLEQAVLETVKTTLLSTPDLRDRIETQVRSALNQSAHDDTQLAELTAQRDAIRKKLELVVDQFDPDMRELIEGKITDLKAQLAAITDRLKRSQPAAPTDEQTIQKTIDWTLQATQDLVSNLSEAPPPTIQQSLRVLIRKLEVDLETRDVVLEIALPAAVDPGAFSDVSGGRSCLQMLERDTCCFQTLCLRWSQEHGYVGSTLDAA